MKQTKGKEVFEEQGAMMVLSSKWPTERESPKNYVNDLISVWGHP